MRSGLRSAEGPERCSVSAEFVEMLENWTAILARLTRTRAGN